VASVFLLITANIFYYISNKMQRYTVYLYLETAQPREKLLVSHRTPPQVADRGTLTRYDGYRGKKYPGWTKTSTDARQFGIELSRARGRKP
jgi:hypothetical protein